MAVLDHSTSLDYLIETVNRQDRTSHIKCKLAMWKLFAECSFHIDICIDYYGTIGCMPC